MNDTSDELKIGDKISLTKCYVDEQRIAIDIIADEFVAENLSNTMMYTIYMLHQRIKALEENK